MSISPAVKLLNLAKWVRKTRERVPHWATTGIHVVQKLGETLPNKDDGLVRDAAVRLLERRK